MPAHILPKLTGGTDLSGAAARDKQCYLQEFLPAMQPR